MSTEEYNEQAVADAIAQAVYLSKTPEVGPDHPTLKVSVAAIKRINKAAKALSEGNSPEIVARFWLKVGVIMANNRQGKSRIII